MGERSLFSTVFTFRLMRLLPKIISIFSFKICLFTFFYIPYKKKVLDREISTSGFRRIYMFWDVLNTISLFIQNVCLCVTQILWLRFHKN